MGATNFWDNQELAKPIIAEMKLLKATIDPIESILREIDDVRALYELGQEAGDTASIEEADRTLADVERKAGKLELQSLLDGPNDPRNCFFVIQAGAGGTEAQD